MTALWIACGIIAFLLLVLLAVLLLRVGALIVYDTRGLRCDLKIGPVKLDLFRLLEKFKQKERLPAAQPAAAEKKRGTPDDLKAALSDVQGLLHAFVPRLRFNQLDIHYVVGGAADPYAAALRFGAASAFFGTVLPVLENICTVRSRNLRTSADFGADQDQVQMRIVVTLAAVDLIKYLVPYVTHSGTASRAADARQNDRQENSTIEMKGGQFNG